MRLFTNNAESTLAAPVSNVALSIQVATGEGARFPSPTGGDYFNLTLCKVTGGVENTIEIVQVTARSSDILTVVRAQEGTTAQTYTTGDRVSLRFTAAPANEFADHVADDANPHATTAVQVGAEPTITGGTTAQYWRGDKTWRDFFTDVRAATLTGLSLASAAAVTAADTVLVAIGLLQKQITDLTTSVADKISTTAIGVTVQAHDADTAKTDVAQSWTAQQTFKELKDTVHTITDGAAFEIDPVNGSVQVVTLGANRTPAATNFEAGQTVLLGIDDGTAYTLTWTTVNPTWVKPGGTASAPALATTGYTWVLLWKVGSVVYGAEVGKP